MWIICTSILMPASYNKSSILNMYKTVGVLYLHRSAWHVLTCTACLYAWLCGKWVVKLTQSTTCGFGCSNCNYGGKLLCCHFSTYNLAIFSETNACKYAFKVCIELFELIAISLRIISISYKSEISHSVCFPRWECCFILWQYYIKVALYLLKGFIFSSAADSDQAFIESYII